MLVSAPGVAISSCKLRTRQDADRGFARPDAGKRPTVLAAAAEQCVRETQVDAAAINEGASQNGCAAKLPSLSFALLHEVNHLQAALYQNCRRHKIQNRLDNVTPIGDRGAAR